MIRGADDRFLARSMAHESVDRCRDGRLATVEGATHWVQHELADRVTSLLLERFA